MKRNRGGQYAHTHTMPDDHIRNIFDPDDLIRNIFDPDVQILKIEVVIQNFDKVVARLKEIKVVQDKGKAPMMEGESVV